jgi:hypothetical protein
MPPTRESRQDVFRRIAQRPHADWPLYDATPLYERDSPGGLASDIRTVSQTWFKHDAHNSVEEFVCTLPLAYFTFDAHDCYAESTRYEMDTLFRMFVLKELHGWEHETALLEYLESHPGLRERLALGSIPDQFSSARRTRMPLSPANRNNPSHVVTIAQTNQTQIPNVSSTKLARSPITSVDSSSQLSH